MLRQNFNLQVMQSTLTAPEECNYTPGGEMMFCVNNPSRERHPNNLFWLRHRSVDFMQTQLYFICSSPWLQSLSSQNIPVQPPFTCSNMPTWYTIYRQ